MYSDSEDECFSCSLTSPLENFSLMALQMLFTTYSQFDVTIPRWDVKCWRGCVYRVTHLLADLGWVDLDLGCSNFAWAAPQLLYALLNLLVYESPTKISKDSGTMALLVDYLPIIHQQAANCIFISARDMGTLIYNFWQP